MAVDRNVWRKYWLIHYPFCVAFFPVAYHTGQNKIEYQIFPHFFSFDPYLCRRKNIPPAFPYYYPGLRPAHQQLGKIKMEKSIALFSA